MNIIIAYGIALSFFCTMHSIHNDCVWVKTTNKEICALDKTYAKHFLLITVLMQKPTKSRGNEEKGSLAKSIKIPLDKSELELLKKAKLSQNPLAQAQRLLKKWKAEDYYTLVDTIEKLKAPVLYAALIQAVLLPELSTKIAQMYLPFAIFRRQFLQQNLTYCTLDIANRTPSRKLLMEYAHKEKNPTLINTISSSDFLPLLPLTSRHKKKHTTVLQIPNKNFQLKAGKFYIKLLRLNGTEFGDQTTQRTYHQKFTQQHGHITCIALHPQGLCFAAGYEKGLITLWILPTHDISIPRTKFYIAGKSNRTNTTAISHLEFSENNTLLSQSDRTILWDIELWHTNEAILIDMGPQAKSLLCTDGSYAITISHKKSSHNSEFIPLIENIRTVTTWDLHKKKIDAAYGKLTLPEALQLRTLTHTY